MSVTVEEIITKIKAEVYPGQLKAFVGELKALKTESGAAQGAFSSLAIGMTGVLVGFYALHKGIEAFTEGLHGVEATEEAMTRLKYSAEQAGDSVDVLAKAAKELSADRLIKMNDALKVFADLADKGFSEDKIKQIGVALKDIAAAAGGNVRENFLRLADAMVTGRVRGAELQRMLPGFTSELKKLGVTTKNWQDTANEAKVQQALFNVVMQRGAEVAGAAAEKMGTLGGQMQAIPNVIAAMKKEFAGGIIEGFTGGSEHVANFSGKLEATIPIIKDVAKYIGMLANVITTVLGTALVSQGSAFAEFWERVGARGGSLPFATIKEFFSTTGNLAVEFDQWLGILPKTEKGMEGFGKATLAAGGAARSTAEDLAGLSEKQQNLLDSFKAQADPMGGMVKKFEELHSVGISADEFARTFASDILTAAAKTREFNIPLSEAGKKLQELAFSFQTLKETQPWDINLAIPATDKDVLESWGKTLGLLDTGSTAQGLRELQSNLALLTPAWQNDTDAMIKWLKQQDLALPKMSALGKAMTAVGVILNSLASAFGSFFGMLANGFNASAAAVSGFQSILKGGFTNILSGISSLIGAAGMLFNVLKNLFGHNWGKDVSNALRDWLPGIQLSDQMIKQLTADAKEMHNAAKALFLDLRQVIDDVGLSAQNVNTFIGELRNGFSLLETDVITSTQLVSVLEDTFNDLATASMSSTGIISNQMREIISLTKQFGLEVQAVTSFIQGQLTAGFQGFDQVFQLWAKKALNMKAPTFAPGQFDIGYGTPQQKKFEHFGNEIVMWVNQMLASGMSVDQVMQLVGGDLDNMVEIAQKFGISLDPALQDIVDLRNETQKLGPIFSGVNAQLVAMANTFETIDPLNFKEIIKDLRGPFKNILEGGLSKSEFLAVRDVLLSIIQMSQQFGLKIPKWVQDIIDAAQDAHFLPKDLTTTVNVKYKDMSANTLTVKRIEAGSIAGLAGGGGSGGRSGRDTYQIYGSTADGGGGGGNLRATAKINFENKTTVILRIDRSGMKEIAKIVAQEISEGKVPLDFRGIKQPLVGGG